MNLKKILNFSLENGLPYIFLSNVFNKIVQFCSSVVLVRFIDKKTYGQWAYANNILSFFLLFSGLGVVNGLMQYASETSDEKRKVSLLKSSFLMGLISNFIISVFVIVFCTFFTLPVEGSVQLLKYLSLIPLISICSDIVTIYLRTALRNKEFSFYSSVSAFLGAGFAIVGAIIFKVYGIIIAKYISGIIVLIIGFFLLRKEISEFKNVKIIPKSEWKEFIRYSVICVLSNSISGLLYIIDTFLIGLIIKDATVVATYKNATLIPFALNFIPQSIIIFVYPYFAKENKDYVKFKEHFKKLVLYMGLLNLIISVLLFVFAPLIIKCVFGAQYMDSVKPFRILSIGFFIAGTFRIPAGNLLASIKQVKYNLFSSIICGIANIILDILFIMKMGSNGAAISTVLIFILDGVMANFYLFWYLKKEIKMNNLQNTLQTK